MAKKGEFLLGAVIGGTAAAVAALLLAPKSGKNHAMNLLHKQMIYLIWLQTTRIWQKKNQRH